MRRILFACLCAGIGMQWIAAVGAGTGSGDDLSAFTTADQLWSHIEELKQGPKTQPHSRAEAAVLFKDYLGRLASSADEFSKRYPQDARRWDAKLLRLQANASLDAFDGKQPDPSTVEAPLKEIARAKDASAGTRADASDLWIRTAGAAAQDTESPRMAAAVDADIVAFLKDHPADPRKIDMEFLRAQLNERIDPARAVTLWKELAQNADPAVAHAAQSRLQVQELKKKPVDMKFTAVDGREIDLAVLRGKVVLIDFWATWCGPCQREIPHVVAAFKKYHGQGFEIIGISLDNDKERLVAQTRELGMTWPQYFDGKVWGNEISSRFGIHAIPSEWLVDKKGFIRSTDPGGKLTNDVEKLLAE